MKYEFDDSGLEGVVEKFSWEYPDKYIYLALVDNGKVPMFVYEHVLNPDSSQGFKQHTAETKDRAKELYEEMKKMYNLEFDKYYYAPEHYGVSD